MRGQLTWGLGYLALVASCHGLLAGCQTTGVVVGIDTDLAVPAPLDGLSLRVVADGTEEFSNDSNPWQLGAEAQLPGTFTLVGRSGRPRLELEVIGWRGAERLVVRQASLRMVEDQVLFLGMLLSSQCVAVECPQGQTCIDGTCRSVEVEASSLPPYQPGLETALSGGSDGGPDDLGEGRDRPGPAADGDGPGVPADGPPTTDVGGSDGTSLDAASSDASGTDSGGVDAVPGDVGSDTSECFYPGCINSLPCTAPDGRMGICAGNAQSLACCPNDGSSCFCS